MNAYVQNSCALMRDLFETQTLLGDFSHDPTKIAVWRTEAAQVRNGVSGSSSIEGSGRLTLRRFARDVWSRQPDLNWRPADYESGSDETPWHLVKPRDAFN